MKFDRVSLEIGDWIEMTRLELIAFRKALGFDTTKLEAQTDEQYESDQLFLEEKYLRSKNP